MSKETGEREQELTLEAVAEKAKEIFLRDNYHPSMVYYSGSQGNDWAYAVPNPENMHGVGRDCAKEGGKGVGELKKAFAVFIGVYGRLGEQAELIGDEEKGFRAVYTNDHMTAGFNPWGQRLKEVLVVAGSDLVTKKTEALVSQIIRNEDGNATELKPLYEGPAASELLYDFMWGYTGDYRVMS